MGNRQNKACEQNSKAVSGLKQESEQVKLYKAKTKKDAVLMYDPQSGIEKFVPLISLDLDNSTILGRRKTLSEMSYQSTSAESMNKGRRKSKKSKRNAKYQLNLSESLVPNLFFVEELESPTVMNELVDFSMGVCSTRMNF